MSREQFCQVVLLPQGEFATLPAAPTPRRARAARPALRHPPLRRRREAAAPSARRGAEAQVRAGDERLLAVAHRIAQAAGGRRRDAAARPARPGRPAASPPAVLAWAAVARCGARERLDIARGAPPDRRGRAGRRRAPTWTPPARTGPAAAAVRARRGARRARWRARRGRPRRGAPAALDAGPPGRARSHDALDLRDAAEREHAARPPRPAPRVPAAARDLADAGAPHGSPALERAASAEELGRARPRRGGRGAALAEIGRRAGRRWTRAGARPTRSDRREADGRWLAGWDDRAAPAAGAARDRAGGRRPCRAAAPASSSRPRARLEAARRRDAAGRGRGGRGRAAPSARASARPRPTRHWLDLRERRIDGIAAELAAELADGEPCRVCGAAEHPAPARPAAGQVDRADEERGAGRPPARRPRRRPRESAHRRPYARRLAAAARRAGDAAAGRTRRRQPAGSASTPRPHGDGRRAARRPRSALRPRRARSATGGPPRSSRPRAAPPPAPRGARNWSEQTSG